MDKITFCLSIHQLMNIGLLYFSIMNNAAINIQGQIFLWTYVPNLLGCIQRNGCG